MQITSATFVKSSQVVADMPPPKMPEYGFVGRSNVGKSSLINALTQRKKLAKTSGTPGKTQLINHFLINESWYLADLPGYGYARVSKTQRKVFQNMIQEYLFKRENLMNVFVLVDSRLEPQEGDLEFMEMLGIKRIPFSIIFTKIDKLKKDELETNLGVYENKLFETWEELPPMMFTSSTSKAGREELLDKISEINELF
ncbi:MAG: ribosome biogenesis GTP-binding protein YihA/YsxC [Bacteroidota bacterium]